LTRLNDFEALVNMPSLNLKLNYFGSQVTANLGRQTLHGYIVDSTSTNQELTCVSPNTEDSAKILEFQAQYPHTLGILGVIIHDIC
jgi:hypothetical protein